MNDYIFYGIIAALLAFAYWMRDKHEWTYPDANHRYCKSCGRCEGHVQGTSRIGGLWHVHDDGDGSCSSWLL